MEKLDKTPSHAHETLEQAIRSRHAVRAYTNKEVPKDVLLEALSLSRLAPSQYNIQNWRVHLASGKAKDRIVASLLAAVKDLGPNFPDLPEQFHHYRSELGHQLYGPDGYNIPRADKAGHNEADLRNFEFFGAPVIGLISMDRGLTPTDAMSVGMFLQTFMLLLAERGLGTCGLISITGYPDLLREQFRLGDDQLILSGISIGYPAEDAPINSLHVSRDAIDESITFLTE